MMSTATAVQIQTTRYRFGSTDRIRIDDVDYIPRSGDRFGHVFARFDSDQRLSISHTHDEIRDLMREGRLLVFARWYDGRKAQLRNSAGTALLSDLSEFEQRFIHWRWEFCERFLRLEMNESGAPLDLIRDYVASQRQTSQKESKGSIPDLK